ncbi:Fatty acid synthase [Eumeta japonica]|uniref:Fatty acid synthase n=1 Tax=Eumeta variegata TaxID=151549 RepID=A0A4C1W5L3_EUMVA|nr:Fatty acid synthase [Eumeta japonica]
MEGVPYLIYGKITLSLPTSFLLLILVPIVFSDFDRGRALNPNPDPTLGSGRSPVPNVYSGTNGVGNKLLSFIFGTAEQITMRLSREGRKAHWTTFRRARDREAFIIIVGLPRNFRLTTEFVPFLRPGVIRGRSSADNADSAGDGRESLLFPVSTYDFREVIVSHFTFASFADRTLSLTRIKTSRGIRESRMNCTHCSVLQYQKTLYVGSATPRCSRALLANRISYWLGVTGPSYTVDSACSSSLYALEHAFRAIRDGQCDAAIVGGTNLCLHPYVSLQFSRLGVLSADGRCKSFDNSANGYARSEAIVACFLQKAKDSRRVYAQILHAKTNCDGYKEQGITYPAGQIQKLLLNEFYEECQIVPSTLEFVEAHGTDRFQEQQEPSYAKVVLTHIRRRIETETATTDGRAQSL